MLQLLSEFTEQDLYLGIVAYFVVGVTLGFGIYKFGINKNIAILYGLSIFSFFGYKVVQDFLFGISLYHDIFENRTGNSVSVYVISTLIVLYFSGVKSNLFILFLCVSGVLILWSASRSGFLSYLVLASYFFLKFSGVRDFSYKSIVLVVLVFLVIFSLPELVLNVFSKFAVKGLSGEGRGSVFLCYFGGLNFHEILFGASNKDITKCFPTDMLNPHNSFVWLHLWSGLFSFAIVLSIIFFYFEVMRRRRFDVFIFMTALLLRSSTDIVLFFKHSDYVFWFLIFSVFGRNPYVAVRKTKHKRLCSF